MTLTLALPSKGRLKEQAIARFAQRIVTPGDVSSTTTSSSISTTVP